MRVLVVVDDAEARRSLCESVRCLAYPVEETEGRAALRLAAYSRPDAVLIGIRPPVSEGYEIARRLRQVADGKKMMLVAVVMDAEHYSTDAAAGSGFDVHLIAPVDLLLLEGLLRNHELTRCE